MDGCNPSGKKITIDDRWMAQAAPLRDTRTIKKMNDQLLLLSLNKITYYYKKLTTGSELSELTLNV